MYPIVSCYAKWGMVPSTNVNGEWSLRSVDALTLHYITLHCYVNVNTLRHVTLCYVNATCWTIRTLDVATVTLCYVA